MDFVIHWNETAMGLHVFPIPIPPPTSLSTEWRVDSLSIFDNPYSLDPLSWLLFSITKKKKMIRHFICEAVLRIFDFLWKWPGAPFTQTPKPKSHIITVFLTLETLSMGVGLHNRETGIDLVQMLIKC